MDTKDYPKDGKRIVRPSARSIIIKENKLALVYSQKYRYYKFPGGGIEAIEDPQSTLTRETKEETGLVVIPSSIQEYGYVRRIQKGDPEGIFIQDNYYYFCETIKDLEQTQLDDYEEEEGFTLVFCVGARGYSNESSSRPRSHRSFDGSAGDACFELTFSGRVFNWKREIRPSDSFLSCAGPCLLLGFDRSHCKFAKGEKSHIRNLKLWDNGER